MEGVGQEEDEVEEEVEEEEEEKMGKRGKRVGKRRKWRRRKRWRWRRGEGGGAYHRAHIDGHVMHAMGVDEVPGIESVHHEAEAPAAEEVPVDVLPAGTASVRLRGGKDRGRGGAGVKTGTRTGEGQV